MRRNLQPDKERKFARVKSSQDTSEILCKLQTIFVGDNKFVDNCFFPAVLLLLFSTPFNISFDSSNSWSLKMLIPRRNEERCRWMPPRAAKNELLVFRAVFPPNVGVKTFQNTSKLGRGNCLKIHLYWRSALLAIFLKNSNPIICGHSSAFRNSFPHERQSITSQALTESSLRTWRCHLSVKKKKMKEVSTRCDLPQNFSDWDQVNYSTAYQMHLQSIELTWHDTRLRHGLCKRWCQRNWCSEMTDVRKEPYR